MDVKYIFLVVPLQSVRFTPHKKMSLPPASQAMGPSLFLFDPFVAIYFLIN